MAEKKTTGKVDLTESSVYGNDDANLDASTDTVDDGVINRLEEVAGSVDDEPGIYEGELGRKMEDLDASTEEEIEALEINLLQDDDTAGISGGTGRISDDLAAERMAGITEVGPTLADKGVVSVTPGRDEPGDILRQHHPNTEVARSEAVIEGNLDEPRDEVRNDRKADEGTAA